MANAGTPWSDLGPRITTALILLLLGGTGIAFGAPIYTLLLIIGLLGILWELGSIVLQDNLRLKLIVIAIGLLFFLAHLMLPLMMQIAGVLAGVALVVMRPGRETSALAFGAAIIGSSIAFLSELRAGDTGLAMTIWFLGIVVMSDVGAYFTGRIVGGPKLWPAVSPGKTRSGALGGVAWALIFGVLFAVVGGLNVALAACVTILLSIASMAGDLAQSAVKRSYGVKDSGTLLPGHGGLWDRFDGVIGAAVLAFLLTHLTPLMDGFW